MSPQVSSSPLTQVLFTDVPPKYPSLIQVSPQVHVPPACRISVPQIDQTPPVHRCLRPAAHQSPGHPGLHAHGHTRHRLRIASDSLDQSTYSKPQSQVSRKVRSAENLRHYRIATTSEYRSTRPKSDSPPDPTI